MEGRAVLRLPYSRPDKVEGQLSAERGVSLVSGALAIR